MSENIQLIKVSMDYQDSFMDGLKECEKESSEQAWIYVHEKDLALPKESFSSYIETLLDYEFTAPEFFVRGITYWAIMGNEVVGRLGLRLELNEELEKLGGHIGYIVRPSFRGQGIASKMLALALETDYAKDIGKLLLTCDLNNEASERTILKNGGVFYDIVELESRANKKRFWIKL